MFCDRIVVLSDGAVCACGTPQTVLTRERLRDVFRVSAYVDISPYHGPPHIRFSPP